MQSPAPLHTLSQPPGPSSPTSGRWDRYSWSLWVGSPSHTASSSAAGSQWAPKRSQSAGGRVEEGKMGQPDLHAHWPHPHLPTPATPPAPSAPCPGPHRSPRGKDAVEHVTSKSHADHQISGIAGGRVMEGREQRTSCPGHTPRSPPTHTLWLPRDWATFPLNHPQRKAVFSFGPLPSRAVSFHQCQPRQESPGTRSPQVGPVRLSPTYPTPIRYRGLSLGSLEVLRATILQNWPLLSPPLRPPMAKPGTSLLVISGGTGQCEGPPDKRTYASSSAAPGQSQP